MASSPSRPVYSFFGHSLRWFLLGISLLAFTLLYADNVAFYFTAICIFRVPKVTAITDNYNDNKNNQTMVDDPKEHFYHDFSARQQNALFSATSFGGIFASLVITKLISFAGTRFVFTFTGIGAALICLLMPLAIQLGFVAAFVLRILQGCIMPVQMVMCSHLTREWSPLSRSGTYLIILSTQWQLAPLLTNPIAGQLCESSLGWPSIYYSQGMLTLLAFVIFFLIYRDNPSEHPCISEKERSFILHGKNAIRDKQQPQAVPYRKILTDPVVWIVLFNFWTDDIGFQLFASYGPIYLNRVLGMDVRSTGLLAALPFLLSIFSKLLSGPINDRLPWKEERIRIYIFSAINQLGMISAFVALTFLPLLPWAPQWMVQAAYASINVFAGLDFLGVIKCSQHISQRFSSTLMAWFSILANLTLFLIPVVVGMMAPNNGVDEWARILIGIALLQTISMVMFFLFCDARPRPWALEEGSDKEKEKAVVSKF